MTEAEPDMTAEELREILARLRWSLRGLADILDVGHTTVVRWASGAYRIPPTVARWLRRVDDWFALHPPPENPAHRRD